MAMKQPLSILSYPTAAAVHINETTAVLAWRERRDAAAARWLRERHHAAILALVQERVPKRIAAERVVQETFDRALALLTRMDTVRLIELLFMTTALQVCREVNDLVLEMAA